jgi:hypothetical protein
MKKLFLIRKLSQQRALPFIAIFAIFGAGALLLVHAATAGVSVEPENATLSGNAIKVTSATASGGGAVKFQANCPAGQVGTPPNCVAAGDVCPAYPAMPDASCTGWQHTGVTLKAVPGQVTSGTGWEWDSGLNYLKIYGNNAVLDGLDVNGCVYIDNTVVHTATVKRSRVTASCPYMFRYENFEASTAMTIQDTELIGAPLQMKGNGFHWLRVNSHGFSGKAAMSGSDSIVEDSWIHDQVCNPPDHQSGLGTNGGASNIIIRHNNVDLTPSECTSGGISNYDDFGAFHNLLIEKNLINSAGYCLKAGFEDNNAAGNSGEQVLNNVFGRKYNAECGSFGIVSNWMPAVSGNVWSGNTWGGGAAATGAHAVGDPVNP